MKTIYEESQHKVLASQNRGAGSYRFGAFDTIEQARAAVAAEIGLETIGDFEERHLAEIGRSVFFETVAESVANYEQYGDPYDATGKEGFRDRDELTKSLIEARGC